MTTVRMLKILVCLVFLPHTLGTSSGENTEFAFNGFGGANLTLDGSASITSNGLLMLTAMASQVKGHAFYPSPVRFRHQPNGKILSFSTTFVVGIIPEYADLGAHGVAFLISATTNFATATGSQYLGLLNSTMDGNSSNHVFAIELDTIESPDVADIDNNHVGIDINSLRSNKSATAGYYEDATGQLKNVSLLSVEPIQVWVEYDGREMQINITLAPVRMVKPHRPLLSAAVNLSNVLSISESMYVGFSSATGSMPTSHYILGWSFKMNGTATVLDYDQLPRLPKIKRGARSKVLNIVLPMASAAVAVIVMGGIGFMVRMRMKYAELHEDWEMEFGAHRFSYKDLFRATKGFRDKELLGIGGFGRVYRGVLPSSNLEVAVKRVSHESKQGTREFIAEVVTLGRLRHRNLVQLLGYCRRKRELLLVYDYMPNGSLDKLLYNQSKPALDWTTRFQIIKGVASGLLYLHEDWEQVVIHRDIKASNVLLDREFSGRLGDFGLARLYDHGSDPQTTHVVGTMGYIAPRDGSIREGNATNGCVRLRGGAFILEVACGRRPVDTAAAAERPILLDWVVENWQKGSISAARDPRLGEEYVAVEMELVMKLGLLCSHPLLAGRPSMRQVVQYLQGSAVLPELSPAHLSFSVLAQFQNEGFESFGDYVSYPSLMSVTTASTISEDVEKIS